MNDRMHLPQYLLPSGMKIECPTWSHFIQDKLERGTCIKGLFWPPLEPKTESCLSPILSNWFIRRIAQALNSGIYFTFTSCYGYQNGRQNRLKIEKLPF